MGDRHNHSGTSSRKNVRGRVAALSRFLVRIPFMLDDTDKQTIASLIEETLENRRRRARLEAEANPAPPKVTKLYLITLTGHQIAFPDERGRAILNQTIYARVSVRENDPTFYAGAVQVVAFGDGKLLPAPMTVILTSSVVAMVEVPESILS
jgi:hypothetical protein